MTISMRPHWLAVGAMLLSLVSPGCGWFSPDSGSTDDPRLFFKGTEIVTSSLTQGSEIDYRDQSYVDTYPVVAQSEQILRVAMQSQDFDPYLEVVDSNGQVIAFDDDSGPDVNAYLAVALPLGIPHTIRATTFKGQTSGDYALSYSLEPITWQQNEIGDLVPGDQQHPEDGSWMDTFSIEGKAGRSLLISLSSYDFDAFLQLVDPDGQVIAFDDDQGLRTDALLMVFLERSGTYQIRVNTYDPEGQGGYVMRYTQQ